MPRAHERLMVVAIKHYLYVRTQIVSCTRIVYVPPLAHIAHSLGRALDLHINLNHFEIK